jgi:Txe/YoeB family toxin of Txe-Axe toxin-antitoxin module
VSWAVLFTKQAQKDARKLASSSPALKQKAQALLELLAHDPYTQPPPYEALVGELRGACMPAIWRRDWGRPWATGAPPTRWLDRAKRGSPGRGGIWDGKAG